MRNLDLTLVGIKLLGAEPRISIIHTNIELGLEMFPSDGLVALQAISRSTILKAV